MNHIFENISAILLLNFLLAPACSQPIDSQKQANSEIQLQNQITSQSGDAEIPFPESSAASLFYFKNDPHLYQEFDVSLVAWGSDPAYVSDAWLSNVISSAKNRGVDYIFANVDVITATSEVLYQQSELQQAIARDLNNEGIVVPWFTTVSTGGIPTWIGCTNHTSYQQHIISKLKKGIDAGANALHLDTPEGSNRLNFGGCFCDTCAAGFRNYLMENISDDDRTRYNLDLTEDFNYRSWLVNEQNISASYFYNRYNSLNRYDIPLINYYEHFQNKAFSDFVSLLHEVLKSYADSDLMLSTNVFNLEPRSLEVITVSDLITNEIEHFPNNLKLPSTHALFCYKLGNALGKRVVTSCAGWEWSTIREHDNMDLLKFWITQAYASGNHFMVPYNQWVISNGEQEDEFYTPDLAVTRPIYAFIKSNRHLFDQTIDGAEITLVFDLDKYAYEINGRDSKIYRLFKNLTDAGFNVQFAVTGSDKYTDLLASRLLSDSRLILVPEDTQLDPELNNWINNAVSSGAVLESISYSSSGYIDWSKSETSENSNIFILPRVKTSNDTLKYIYHMLNTDYSGFDRTISAQSDVVVRLSPENYSPTKKWVAKWYQEGSNTELEVSKSENEITLTIPSISIYGVLELSTKVTNGTSIANTAFPENVEINIRNQGIHIEGVSENMSVQLFNVLGQLVYSSTISTDATLYPDDHLKGLHILQLINKSHQIYARKVFIN